MCVLLRYIIVFFYVLYVFMVLRKISFLRLLLFSTQAVKLTLSSKHTVAESGPGFNYTQSALLVLLYHKSQ